jgi:hypothetical protein
MCTKNLSSFQKLRDKSIDTTRLFYEILKLFKEATYLKGLKVIPGLLQYDSRIVFNRGNLYRDKISAPIR